MKVDDKLLELRKIARERGKYVMNKLFDDYLTGLITKKVIPSCSFCGEENNITKEHILPKWVFESNSKHSFKSDVNELDQPYIKATIPLCSRCNSDLFNSVERKIQRILSQVDLQKRYYSPEEWELVIRWLEVIDFKFQIWDISTKFRAHKRAGYIPALSDFSIAFMRDTSVRSVTSKARQSLKRISIKGKDERHKCLIVGTTKNKTFHYFHTSGDFIYLEIPTFNKGFFYFYERDFKNDSAVKREAMKIIKSAYNL